MRKIGYTLALALTFVLCTLPAESIRAGVFGEVAASVGGIYPQGSFTRYADPGFMGNARATIHIPSVEFMVGWFDFAFTQFSSETVETSRVLYDFDNGVTIRRPVDQTTKETMFALHLGGQISSASRRAFIRPRAGLGIGLYHFRNTISWTEQDADTTVTLASESLDRQTSFGWRALLGVDLFFTDQWGGTVDFIYDHVFELNQQDGPSANADLTSRFQGFSVGVIYMFAVP